MDIGWSIMDDISHPRRFSHARRQPEEPAGHRVPVVVDGVRARQILDSRGNPTLTVRLVLADGTAVEASAPAGASTGAHEAIERRDGLPAYGGKGVTEAVALVDTVVDELIAGRRWASIGEVDDALRELDGSQICAGSEPTASSRCRSR